jgi:hypothetical protein
MGRNEDIFKGSTVKPSRQFLDALRGYDMLWGKYRYLRAIRIVAAKIMMHTVYDLEDRKVKYIGESKAELLSWIMVTLQFKERDAYSILKAARNNMPPGGRELVEKTWDFERKGKSLYDAQSKAEFRREKQEIERLKELIRSREEIRQERVGLLSDRWYKQRRLRRSSHS